MSSSVNTYLPACRTGPGLQAGRRARGGRHAARHPARGPARGRRRYPERQPPRLERRDFDRGYWAGGPPQGLSPRGAPGPFEGRRLPPPFPRGSHGEGDGHVRSPPEPDDRR